MSRFAALGTKPEVAIATAAPRPRVEAAAKAAEASRGSAIRLGAEVGGRVLTFAATVLIARALGVAEFGRFAAASGLAVVLAELGDLGLQALAARALVAGELTLSDMVRARALLLLCCLVPLAGALWVTPLLAILILYFLLANWVEFFGVALRAFGAPLREAGVLLLLRAAALGGALYALRRPAPVLLAIALAVSTIPALLLAFGLLNARVARPLHGPRVRPRAVLQRSFPLGLNGGLALMSTKVELLSLPLLRSVAEAGLFAGALRLVEPLLAVPGAIAAGAMPALTREGMAGGGPVRRRTSITVALLAAPAAIGLAIAAPSVIRLFGQSFASASGTLSLLALAIVPAFVNTVLLHSLIAVGRARWLPRLTAVRVGTAAALAALLLPSFGARGGALGFTLSELTLLLLASRACAAARFHVPVSGPLAAGIALSIPMAVVVALAPGGASLSVGLGVVTYAVSLFLAWRFVPRFAAEFQG